MTEQKREITVRPCGFCASREIECADYQIDAPWMNSEGKMPRDKALVLAAAPALLDALRALVADCVANPGDEEYAREPGFASIDAAREAIRLATEGTSNE